MEVIKKKMNNLKSKLEEAVSQMNAAEQELEEQLQENEDVSFNF